MPATTVVIDLYAASPEPLASPDAARDAMRAALDAAALPGSRRSRRVADTRRRRARRPRASPRGRTASPSASPGARAAGYDEDELYRGLHPMMGKRMNLWRLENFALERLPSADEDVFLFHARARDNPRDERLFALAEVRDLTPVRDAAGRVVALPRLEQMLLEGLAASAAPRPGAPRTSASTGTASCSTCGRRSTSHPRELNDRCPALAPDHRRALGLEQVLVHVRVRAPGRRASCASAVLSYDVGHRGRGSRRRAADRADQPLRRLPAEGARGPAAGAPSTRTRSSGCSARRSGGSSPSTTWTTTAALVPVDRPPGENTAHVVVGMIKSHRSSTRRAWPASCSSAIPSKELGALSRARVQAGHRRARSRRAHARPGRLVRALRRRQDLDGRPAPRTWTGSPPRSGASSTFTQAGFEINVVVSGINVGAQPYWNAEATMLMHTRGILVMTPDTAMVLTGKQALDYSGSVSAEDNLGIGGYDRIMGPNGQAQYWAEDIVGACRVLLAHYEHTYVAPGERFPRRAAHARPARPRHPRLPHPRRAALRAPWARSSPPRRTRRKKPFDIRAVMSAVVDHDHPPLERWKDMAGAETAVVWDARIGGHAACLLGIESRPLPRRGFVPADGPDSWHGGHALPALVEEGRRGPSTPRATTAPLVVLANLSGFDGSPESMRQLQLEYGAEIGRAIVNFARPDRVLRDLALPRRRVRGVLQGAQPDHDGLAVEGAYASVIGGAPAAAVVFSAR